MPKKRKAKKKVLVTNILLVAFALIIIALLVQIIFSPIKLSPVKIIAQQTDPQTFTDIQTQQPISIETMDFPNPDEGTFSGWLKPNYFKEPIDPVVILFISAKIPGVSLMYYPKENKVIAGSPQMTAENIILFDGQKHQIVYAFKKGAQQYFFYDGSLVAGSNFKPYSPEQITGLITGVPQPQISELFYQIEIS